jgi:glycosyltransferase involved in cell wall biosynthesis
MKILIVINSLLPGGAEKQAVLDANYMQKKGHRVTLAFANEGKLHEILNRSVTCYKINSNNIIPSFLQMFFHFLSHKYDIIHSHMFWGAKVSVIPGKLTGHKVVMNEHGLGLWRRWYHILTLKFLSLFADKIVNSCETSKRIRLKRENLKKEKLITVYNSVEMVSKITKADSSVDISTPKAFTIGFVGRFNEVKRLGLFPDLAERLKKTFTDFKIVLIGDGEEKERIEDEIKRRNLTRCFELPGFVLQPEKYYRTFDVFMLLSRIEGFSVALIEAEASGIPAIAFDVGGNSEIIKDRVTGFLVPDLNLETLVERIHYLYAHPQKRKEMGKAALEYVKANFSIENRVKKLDELYREILKKGK